MENSKHSNYKNKNIQAKYLNNMQNIQFLKVKKQVYRVRKRFYRIKRQKLKDIEVKIKMEIDELFFKPIIVSIDDMDKFEQNEMEKKRPIKNIQYDWLINYIPNPIRKTVGGFKNKAVSLFKTNIPKN